MTFRAVGLGVLFVASATLLGAGTRGTAAIIFVDDTAPASSANDGTSWENAFFELQNALTIAKAGDEVRVAQGLYKPAAANGSRDLTFTVPNGVIVEGGFAGFGAENPDELDHKQFITTLSGDLNGDDGPNFANYAENSYNVVLADGVDASTTLIGLTIRGGNADLYSFWPYDRRTTGGGIRAMNGAYPTMIDCTVRENRSHFGGGGGMHTDGLSATRCRFISNETNFGAVAPAGALWINGAAHLDDCLFQSNDAGNSGGALYHYSPQGKQIVLRKCRFIGNYSNEAAGAFSSSGCLAIETDFIVNAGFHGIGAATCSNSTFLNCRFLGNLGGCYGFGGSALDVGDNVSISNCLFSGNLGSWYTLSVYHKATGVVIANCAFVGNESSCEGAAVTASNGTTIANTIIWDNQHDNTHSPPDTIQASQISATPSTVLVHNIIQGWDGTLGGVNNSGDDPQFIDDDGEDNDYGTDDDNPLRAASPAIDSGDNTYLPADEFDLDGDGDTREPLPLDLDLMPRIVNGVVDLGPYEHPEPCPADIAPPTSGGNGVIDVDDLLLVINNWGNIGPNVADITGNGIVDVDDLLAVINASGTLRVKVKTSKRPK